jgi:hypothetical protein
MDKGSVWHLRDQINRALDWAKIGRNDEVTLVLRLTADALDRRLDADERAVDDSALDELG